VKGLLNVFKRLFGWITGKTGSKTAQEAASFAIGQASAITLEPFFRILSYQTNQLLPFNKADISSYIEAYLKGKVSEEELQNNLREMGLDSRQINIILEARKALLGVGEIQTLYNRGEITEEEAKNRFAQLGFAPEYQEELIKLAGYIPSVADFIRMAVREVFTPAVAEKYGQFEDYPPDLDKYAKMAGLNPEYAKYYWAAHWELPSFSQGIEMFHRGIISRDELVTLLKSLDVMPYWRERLIKLSETPFTRVDVRRMYQMGILSFEETVRAYMDLGYSAEKAEKLAEFTAQGAIEEERNLTKTEVATLYRGGTISREDAANFLQSIGYPPEHVEFILLLEDYRKGKERLSMIKTAVKRRYIRGFISRNDVVVLLSKEGIPAKEIEELVRSWDLEKEEKAGLPTKAELKRFYQKEIITIEEYKDMMKRLGYPEVVITWYVKDLTEEG